MYEYDPSAKAVIEALTTQVDATETLWGDSILHGLLQVSPVTAFLPRLLREDDIWSSSHRYQFLRRMAGDLNYSGPSSSNGCFLGQLMQVAESMAAEEGAPWVTEWHIAAVLGGGSFAIRDNLSALGVNCDALLDRARTLAGRVELSTEDREKLWCFCDTNLFLHYTFFNEVDWHVHLGAKNVVLVVPMVVVRELDGHKTNPNPQRSQLRERARKVLRRLGALAFSAPPGKPTTVRSGVEIMLQGHEPAVFPQGLDPVIGDDRIVAAALEFRWTRPGSQVTVLSGDLAVRLKASARGLAQREIPESLQLKRPDTKHEADSS